MQSVLIRCSVFVGCCALGRYAGSVVYSHRPCVQMVSDYTLVSVEWEFVWRLCCVKSSCSVIIDYDFSLGSTMPPFNIIETAHEHFSFGRLILKNENKNFNFFFPRPTNCDYNSFEQKYFIRANIIIAFYTFTHLSCTSRVFRQHISFVDWRQC